MVCIYCHSKTKVSNSRGTSAVWRRRQCLICKSIFTTYEHPDYASALRVEQSNTRLEAFSRDKLFMSLHRALAHRKTATDDAGGLCNTIIHHLAREHRNGLLTNKHIALTARDILQRFDAVAASVYSAKHSL